MNNANKYLDEHKYFSPGVVREQDKGDNVNVVVYLRTDIDEALRLHTEDLFDHILNEMENRLYYNIPHDEIIDIVREIKQELS